MTSEGGGRMAGQVALVTGGASGIGRAAARLLAEEGAAVAVADRDEAGARETAGQITEAGGAARVCVLDVTSEAAWQATMEEVLGASGRVDVVVNAAGVSYSMPVAEMPLEQWRRVLAVNLDGVFLGTRAALRAMRPRGTGSVVNVASAAGVKAIPGAAAYCASKAAVVMLSRAAALECAGGGVRVNCVLPGGVKTPLWRQMAFWSELVTKHGGEEAAFAAMAQAVPLRRYAEPDEIARAILYLASDESAYVTGAELVIDGGYTA
jgi:NAD(P)-dependent dehydrogenase (short-subunit alcohol dehydrogenase family)